MKVSVKMEKCKFFVDEEKRTVVCRIENTKNMVLDFFNLNIWEGYENRPISFTVNYKMEDKLRMPNCFIGKAVCSPDDEWNEEAGRLIAFSRAKDNLENAFFLRAQLFINAIGEELGALVDAANAYGERLDRNAKRREQHIQRIAPNYNK